MADSLVDQIFEQARLGSAQGQGIPGFAEGQRINLANRQLGVELAQLPLKMTLAGQQAQMNQLQIEQTLKDRSEALDAEKNISQLASEVAPLLKDGKAEEALNRIAAAGVSNNVLLINPRYQNLQKQVDQMWQLKNQQQRYLNLSELSAKRLSLQEFKALPKHEQLLRRANEVEDVDPELAADLRKNAALEQDKFKLEQDKLAVRKGELAARNERNNIRQQALNKSLDSLSRAAMQSELRQVENNAKMTPDEQEAKTDSILQKYEAKTKRNTEVAPSDGTVPPANAAGDTSPVVRNGVSMIYVRKKDTGQTGWMPLDNFAKDQFEQLPTPQNAK